MSSIRTYAGRGTHSDHFQPGDDMDPQAQRALRGALEAIDFAAYAANKQVIGEILGRADVQKFQRLGMAAAAARSRWVAAALASTDGGALPSHEQVQKLAQLRMAYEELTEVYDAMRRMVERGYLAYGAQR